MAQTLVARCACGALTFSIREASPAVVNRVVCHCRGCRTWPQLLDKEDRILDEHGGSDIFQMSPASLTVTAGQEHLACAHLTPKGVLRWYASCCDTPMANTLQNPRWPFVGVLTGNIDTGSLNEPLDAHIGPVLARVNRKFPRDQRAALEAGPASLLGMLAHYIPLFFSWRFRGHAHRSPFFHPETLEPVAPLEYRATELLPAQT